MTDDKPKKAPRKKYQILKSFAYEGKDGEAVKVSAKIRVENADHPIHYIKNITYLPKKAVELGKKLGCIREVI